MKKNTDSAEKHKQITVAFRPSCISNHKSDSSEEYKIFTGRTKRIKV